MPHFPAVRVARPVISQLCRHTVPSLFLDFALVALSAQKEPIPSLFDQGVPYSSRETLGRWGKALVPWGSREGSGLPKSRAPGHGPHIRGSTAGQGDSSVLQLTRVSPAATGPRPSAFIQSAAGNASWLD